MSLLSPSEALVSPDHFSTLSDLLAPIPGGSQAAQVVVNLEICAQDEGNKAGGRLGRTCPPCSPGTLLIPHGALGLASLREGSRFYF